MVGLEKFAGSRGRSAQAKGVTVRGPYHLEATVDAPAIPGAKPLVVISHGNGGSDMISEATLAI